MLKAFLSYGFRPFFLGAALLAVGSIAQWLAIYFGYLATPPALGAISPAVWHAHEMVFGYTLAVIAGFLLTAVRNWTQLPGVEGRALAWLFVLWLVPRVLISAPQATPVGLALSFDLAFIACFILSIAAPIAKSGQLRRQAGIVSKLCLLALSHAAFYWGVLSDQPQLLYTSLYSALYLVVALCMTLARRLIPFFVKSATGLELPTNSTLDRASLALFFLFWLSVVSLGHSLVTAVLSLGLAAVHSARLWQWRASAILGTPLLWVLYAAYAWFIAGFALIAAVHFAGLTVSVGIHALAVGGIGTLTVGMMARVSWGHTGRPLARPPATLTPIFLVLIGAALARVVGPLVAPQWYTTWILAAGLLWSAALVGFLIAYTPVLVGPRPDGQG